MWEWAEMQICSIGLTQLYQPVPNSIPQVAQHVWHAFMDQSDAKTSCALIDAIFNIMK